MNGQLGQFKSHLVVIVSLSIFLNDGDYAFGLLGCQAIDLADQVVSFLDSKRLVFHADSCCRHSLRLLKRLRVSTCLVRSILDSTLWISFLKWHRLCFLLLLLRNFLNLLLQLFNLLLLHAQLLLEMGVICVDH